MNTKIIKVMYHVVDFLSPYNTIMGRPTLNLLRAVVLTMHLCIKYALPSKRVGVAQWDQETS